MFRGVVSAPVVIDILEAAYASIQSRHVALKDGNLSRDEQQQQQAAIKSELVDITIFETLLQVSSVQVSDEDDNYASSKKAALKTWLDQQAGKVDAKQLDLSELETDDGRRFSSAEMHAAVHRWDCVRGAARWQEVRTARRSELRVERVVRKAETAFLPCVFLRRLRWRPRARPRSF